MKNGSESTPLSFSETVKIGENDYGYQFGAGLMSGGWHGFAISKMPDGDRMIFFLPNCDSREFLFAESPTGEEARAAIIKMVGAIAESIEHGYGGIKRWFVEESLRGKPEDYTCEECGSVGCSPEFHDEYF